MMNSRLSALVILFAIGCNQAPSDLYDGPAFGRIGGFVYDLNGDPVPNVSVELQGIYAETDATGMYVLDGVTPGDDLVVSFIRPGYAKGYAVTNLISWETVSVDKTLMEIDGYGTFPADVGGMISVNGVDVTFSPNSVVDASGQPYHGEVTVEITYVDPYTDALDAAPGDLRALAFSDDGAKTVSSPAQLVSYGMSDITLYDEDGEPIQLAEGETADVEMPITNGVLPTLYHLAPGARQQTWSFSPARGRWLEEGEGQVVEGPEGEMRFSFQATHFSWWNCDQGFVPTCASGRVIDTIGFPVRGATLQARGNQSTTTVTTDEEGYYVVTVMTGDTVNFTGSTFVGSRTWSAGQSKYIDGEGSSAATCEPIPDIQIEVCRESGVIMAENLELHVSGLEPEQNGDQLRAWFWEPAGDPWLCENPWDNLEPDDCMSTTPNDFPSHLDDQIPGGMDIRTKSAGNWIELTTPRSHYRLDKENINGDPRYFYETVEMSDDGEVTFNDLDLRGGDVMGLTAPGNPSDYFGAMSDTDFITLPTDVSLTNISGPQTVNRSSGMDIHTDRGNSDWGMLVLVTQDPDSTSLVCRYADDGSFRISPTHLNQLDPSWASVSIYRPQFGWTAGPDGLPIRRQILSGSIVETDLN